MAQVGAANRLITIVNGNPVTAGMLLTASGGALMLAGVSVICYRQLPPGLQTIIQDPMVAELAEHLVAMIVQHFNSIKVTMVFEDNKSAASFATAVNNSDLGLLNRLDQLLDKYFPMQPQEERETTAPKAVVIAQDDVLATIAPLAQDLDRFMKLLDKPADDSVRNDLIHEEDEEISSLQLSMDDLSESGKEKLSHLFTSDNKEPVLKEVNEITVRIARIKVSQPITFNLAWFLTKGKELVDAAKGQGASSSTQVGDNLESFLTGVLVEALASLSPKPVVDKFEIQGARQYDVVICKGGKGVLKREMKTHGVLPEQVLAVIEVKSQLQSWKSTASGATGKIQAQLQPLLALKIPTFAVAFDAYRGQIMNWLEDLTATNYVLVFPGKTTDYKTGYVFVRDHGNVWRSARVTEAGHVLLALFALFFPIIAPQSADLWASIAKLYADTVKLS